MSGLFVLALALPVGRSFYDVHLPPPSTLFESIALGGAAAVALELSGRVAARFRHRPEAPTGAVLAAAGGDDA